MIDENKRDNNRDLKGGEKKYNFNRLMNSVRSLYGFNASASVQDQMFERNLKAVRYVSLIILATSIFWLVADSIRGGALRLTVGWGLAAIICQMVFSVYMLILPFLPKDKKGRLVRYSFLVYYICLITTVFILGVTKNNVLVSSGNYSSATGIPLSSYYLFILVICPLPSMRDSIILGVYYVIMQLLPLFLPGHEAYNIAAFSVLAVCMILAYAYVFRVNCALSDSLQKLSVMSYTDPLTNVFNRRSLDASWSGVYAEKEISSIGIMMFDIDDFKKYNDHYTHSEGDVVLREVCNIIQTGVDNVNGTLYRYGGEEFVILLYNITDEELVENALTFKDAIFNANIARDDGSVFDRITITVGCALEIVRMSDGSRDHLACADEQLYVGKGRGKNCVVFKDTVYR